MSNVTPRIVIVCTIGIVFLLSLGYYFSSLAPSATSMHLLKKIDCALNDQTFSLQLKTPYPLANYFDDPIYAYEEATLWLAHNNKVTQLSSFETHNEVIVMGEMAEAFAPASEIDSSLCSGVPAYEVGKNKILFGFAVDNRPFGLELTALVFDLDRHKIIDRQSGLDEISSESSVFKPASKGFSFIARYNPTDSAACGIAGMGPDKCNFKINGQTPKRMQDFGLEHIKEVTFENNKIVVKENVDQTFERTDLANIDEWERTSMKDYFSSLQEFAINFEYDAEQDTYANLWYLKAQLPNGTICIYPTTGDRELPANSAQWFCAH